MKVTVYLLIITASICANPLNTAESEITFRIEDNIKPSKYKIIIEPNVSEKTFKGEVHIYLKATRTAVRTVVLNIFDLDIDNDWRLTREDRPGFSLPKGLATPDKDAQRTSFAFTTPLDLDTEYTFISKYSGKMQSENGFFASAEMYGTKSTPIYARSIFPCFDEPHFKTEFQLTVNNVGNLTVISNGLVGTREETEEKVDYYFPTTKSVIPPHSFGFLISNCQNLSNEATLSVWSLSGDEKLKQFALDAAQKIIKNINDFTGYSLAPLTEKIDLVALPEVSWKSTALLGSAYFRELYLLHDEHKTSNTESEMIIREISNKIARQWFEVLVTPEFWNHIWISHGISKYMEPIAFPEDYNLIEKVGESLQEGLVFDSCDTTHAIVNNLEAPTEIIGLTDEDEINSNKAAGILRWIEVMIGSDNFRTHLRKFIKENEFKSITTEDFMKAFDENVLDSKISLIFKEWIEKPGYPLLTVTRSGSKVVLSQRRFFLRPPANEGSTQRWHIPISIGTNEKDFNEIVPTHLFPNTVSEWEMTLTDDNAAFFVLNKQQLGFYRVNYDSSSWNAIKQTLNGNKIDEIHVLNRAQIVDDLFALAESKTLNYDFVYDILEYLTKESAYQPWKSAFNGFKKLSLKEPSAHDDYHKLFKSYTRWFIRSLYEKLRYHPVDSEDHLTTLLRSEMLYFACKYDVAECTIESQNLFKAFKDKDEDINANLEYPALCSAVRSGTKDEFDFVWRKYVGENFEARKLRFISAMTCTKHQELVENLLAKILTGDVKSNNKLGVFEKVLTESPLNVDTILNYLEKNWKTWKEQVCIVKTIKAISGVIFKESQVDTFKKIVDAVKKENILSESETKIVNKAVEDASYSVSWTNERLPELYQRMKKLDFIWDDNGAFGIYGQKFMILVASFLPFVAYRVL